MCFIFAVLGTILWSCASIQDPTFTQNEASRSQNYSSTQSADRESPDIHIKYSVDSRNLGKWNNVSAIEKKVYILNQVIRDKQFGQWTTHLTNDYIAYYSDKQNLARISLSPALAANNWILKDLRDYFNLVVQPARNGISAIEIRIVDDSNAIVYAARANRERLILYYLQMVGSTWKVGNWRQ